jgi:hypothetical protein
VEDLLGKRVYRCLKCHMLFDGKEVPAPEAPPPVAPPAPAPPPVVQPVADRVPRRPPPRPRVERWHEEDDDPVEEYHGAPAPAHVVLLAFLPWGLVAIALGALVSVVLALVLTVVGVGIALSRRSPVAARFHGLVVLNVLAYAGVGLFALFSLALPGPAGGPEAVAAATNPPAGGTQAPAGGQALPPGGAGNVAPQPPPPPVEVLPPIKDLFARRSLVYLSDLDEFGVREGAWPFTKRGLLGDTENKKIEVDAFRSPHGLSMHPPSVGYAAAKYRLGKQASRFRAEVALNDSSGGAFFGPAFFEVLGDRSSLWKSGPIQKPHRLEHCDVDVRVVDVLELRVSTGNLNMELHAVWLEPRLLKKANTRDVSWPPVSGLFADGPRVYLSDRPRFDVLSGPWPVSPRGKLGNGSDIQVNGERYPHGIGMHPPDKPAYASAKFRLGGQAAVFKAGMALDDSTGGSRDACVFEVWGDGERLWHSEPVSKPRQIYKATLDVTGVKVLELRAASQGSHFGLHAVWLEPRVLKSVATPDTDGRP